MKDGRSPLDVMIGNMRFWDAESDRLLNKLENFATLVANGVITEPEQIKEGMKLLRLMLNARDKAQECAVDAAPYVHPRLAAIVPKPADDPDNQMIGGLPPIVLDVHFETVPTKALTAPIIGNEQPAPVVVQGDEVIVDG